MVEEYILLCNNEMYRVYAQNEKLAVKTFLSVCESYTITKNSDYKEYWKNIIDLINDGNYTLIHNSDFKGVRKI